MYGYTLPPQIDFFHFHKLNYLFNYLASAILRCWSACFPFLESLATFGDASRGIGRRLRRRQGSPTNLRKETQQSRPQTGTLSILCAFKSLFHEKNTSVSVRVKPKRRRVVSQRGERLRPVTVQHVHANQVNQFWNFVLTPFSSPSGVILKS